MLKKSAEDRDRTLGEFASNNPEERFKNEEFLLPLSVVEMKDLKHTLESDLVALYDDTKLQYLCKLFCRKYLRLPRSEEDFPSPKAQQRKPTFRPNQTNGCFYVGEGQYLHKLVEEFSEPDATIGKVDVSGLELQNEDIPLVIALLKYMPNCKVLNMGHNLFSDPLIGGLNKIINANPSLKKIIIEGNPCPSDIKKKMKLSRDKPFVVFTPSHVSFDPIIVDGAETVIKLVKSFCTEDNDFTIPRTKLIKEMISYDSQLFQDDEIRRQAIDHAEFVMAGIRTFGTKQNAKVELL